MKWRRLAVEQRVDSRGNLGVLELGSALNLNINRFFWIESPNEAVVRGNHAHRTCVQVLICLKGEIEVSLMSGSDEESIVLTPESEALIIEPLVWATQEFKHSKSLLLVGATEAYNKDEFITDWDEFNKLSS